MTELGKLERVPLRSVWPHEAHDFTQWLALNAQAVTDVIGLPFSVTGTERMVGDFRLDIVGEDADGGTVLIENQYGATDHDHLGKIMTYAAGVDPRTIVWIAETFRSEHRDALEWINSVTPDTLSVYGLTVEAFRIGDSLPAPRLQLIVAPSDHDERTRAFRRLRQVERRVEWTSERVSYLRHILTGLMQRGSMTQTYPEGQPNEWPESDFSNNNRFTVRRVAEKVCVMVGLTSNRRPFVALELDSSDQLHDAAFNAALEEHREAIYRLVSGTPLGVNGLRADPQRFPFNSNPEFRGKVTGHGSMLVLSSSRLMDDAERDLQWYGSALGLLNDIVETSGLAAAIEHPER